MRVQFWNILVSQNKKSKKKFWPHWLVFEGVGPPKKHNSEVLAPTNVHRLNNGDYNVKYTSMLWAIMLVAISAGKFHFQMLAEFTGVTSPALAEYLLPDKCVLVTCHSSLPSTLWEPTRFNTLCHTDFKTTSFVALGWRHQAHTGHAVRGTICRRKIQFLYSLILYKRPP